MAFYPYVGATKPRAFALTLEALDPDRRIDALIERLAPVAGRSLLDVGAGSGLLALRFARRAAIVHALEPDPRMLRQIHGALAAEDAPTEHVSVLAADAEAIPLPNASVDIVHARFAYFFGSDACLPGLAEAKRVLNPGGSIMVIEGSTRLDFGWISRRVNPSCFTDQTEVLRFWANQGFDHHEVDTCWRASDRATMREALALEMEPATIEEVMARFPSTELSYAVHVFHWRAPRADG